MADIKQTLTEILEEKFKQEDCSSFFIVDIIQSADEHIQVFIDHDNGLQLEHCVMLSRFLEKHIEENALLSDTYTLDVSSPGVGSPLKLKRQYEKNIGRLLGVELNDTHVNANGMLIAVHDDYIVLEYSEKVLVEEGKKKKKEITVQKNIPFENIKKAIVKISF